VSGKEGRREDGSEGRREGGREGGKGGYLRDNDGVDSGYIEAILNEGGSDQDVALGGREGGREGGRTYLSHGKADEDLFSLAGGKSTVGDTDGGVFAV